MGIFSDLLEKVRKRKQVGRNAIGETLRQHIKNIRKAEKKLENSQHPTSNSSGLKRAYYKYYERLYQQAIKEGYPDLAEKLLWLKINNRLELVEDADSSREASLRCKLEETSKADSFTEESLRKWITSCEEETKNEYLARLYYDAIKQAIDKKYYDLVDEVLQKIVATHLTTPIEMSVLYILKEYIGRLNQATSEEEKVMLRMLDAMSVGWRQWGRHLPSFAGSFLQYINTRHDLPFRDRQSALNKLKGYQIESEEYQIQSEKPRYERDLSKYVSLSSRERVAIHGSLLVLVAISIVITATIFTSGIAALIAIGAGLVAEMLGASIIEAISNPENAPLRRIANTKDAALLRQYRDSQKTVTPPTSKQQTLPQPLLQQLEDSRQANTRMISKAS